MLFHKKLKPRFFLTHLLLLLPWYIHAADKRYAKPTAKQEPTEKVFLFDRYWSPCATASLLMSARTFLNGIKSWPQTGQAQQKLWVRIFDVLVELLIINEQLRLFNHEVYGHGFRIRSLGGRVADYRFTLFEGAATCWNPWPGITADEFLLIHMAGTEANYVLAQEIALRHFKYRKLDNSTYNLFFTASWDLMNYISLTHRSEIIRNHPGNDVMNYIKMINNKHQLDGISLDDLNDASIVFLLNPMFYAYLWSVYVYLAKGQREISIPHLQWDEIAYMPLLRMALTPFGIAYYLDNYLGNPAKTFLISLYTGSSPFYTSYYGGLACKTDRLWSYKSYALDLEGNLWYQPPLQLAPADALGDKNYWGGLVGFTNKFQITPQLSLYVAALYKTQGFVEGVVAAGGFMGRAGFSLHY